MVACIKKISIVTVWGDVKPLYICMYIYIYMYIYKIELKSSSSYFVDRSVSDKSFEVEKLHNSLNHFCPSKSIQIYQLIYF